MSYNRNPFIRKTGREYTGPVTRLGVFIASAIKVNFIGWLRNLPSFLAWGVAALAGACLLLLILIFLLTQ